MIPPRLLPLPTYTSWNTPYIAMGSQKRDRGALVQRYFPAMIGEFLNVYVYSRRGATVPSTIVRFSSHLVMGTTAWPSGRYDGGIAAVAR
ncbi:hypothetical protein ACRALDRAFT_1064169 [Sodiomyces alcalophilus JCM 7366]|uniref:uncharacterized protein n=1 Tax=Sodiomyces alcalophilus JCM 7366 TaxID=591952 RepID=UPI0039B42308